MAVMVLRRSGAAILSIFVVVALLVVSVWIHLSGDGRAATPPKHAKKIANWSPSFMTWPIKMSKQKAIEQAKIHDVIAYTKATYRPFIDDMKAENPQLSTQVYLNAVFVKSTEKNAYPEAWYVKDRSGNKIRSKDFGNYLMDPSHPGWVGQVVQTCKEYLDFSNADGCFLDVLGPAPVDPGYSTGTPINKSTGQPWTRKQWLAATSQLGAQVKAGAAPALVYGNGLLHGGRYFDPDAPTSVILNGIDGGMVELFARSPFSGINDYKNEAEWKKDVEMLTDAGARGKSITVTTKTWSGGTEAQQTAWHRYSLATFLMGFQPGFYYSFLYNDHDALRDHPYWKLDLGAPVGTYGKRSGVYERVFQNGRALVNPTNSSQTVNVGGTYENQDGQPVTGSVVLRAHEGEILIGATGGGPTPSPDPTPTATPTPTPTVSPVPIPRIPKLPPERRVTMTLSGHIQATGRIVGDAEFGQCLGEHSIKVQKKNRDKWVTLAWTSTDPLGNFRMRLEDKLGQYRAVAVKEIYKSLGIPHVCGWAASDAEAHRH